MKLKKLAISLLILFQCFNILAVENFLIQDDKYKINAVYEKVSYPGQAFFVKLIISAPKSKAFSVKANATLMGQKEIISNDFYVIKKDKTLNQTEMLVGLPMWSWEVPEENASITIKYSVNNDKEKSILLPVIIAPKKYLEETIHLNSKLSDLIGTTDTKKKEELEIFRVKLKNVDQKSVYEFEGFIRPTDGTRITSEFAQNRTFVYSNGKKSPSYHTGLDFGIPTGSEIVACGSGKVIMARWRTVTGYSVVIEHLPGLFSVYFHLSELKCKEGDVVNKGDLIALSGATGLATGPHLHWEVRMNYVCLDPDSLISDFAYNKDNDKFTFH